MYNELLSKQKTLAVIGLGYVGLPIALLFARKLKVIGYDINERRIAMMHERKDPSGELGAEAFEGCDIKFTANEADLKQANFFLVTVPTPIDAHNKPDLTPVLSASRAIARNLKKGDYVVYESTVYPGCTEEDCVPLLEESGLKMGTEFKVGYSPERINPGDPHNKLEHTRKIVSGCDAESLSEITKTYQLAIQAELHQATSIKVAEAAKIIENTQRDLNIALMNELSIIFAKMGINTYDVIDAAATKWNFHRYMPGLVGGHCIGVDPYYLTFKAQTLGHNAKVILAGREINDGMGFYIAENLVKRMIAADKKIQETRVLVMGATFKENVQDIRNSKVADLIRELKAYSVNVDVVDPHADSDELHHEYGFSLVKMPRTDYDGIVVAVAHDDYRNLKEDDFRKLTNEEAFLIDLKGLYRNQIHKLHYWSL